MRHKDLTTQKLPVTAPSVAPFIPCFLAKELNPQAPNRTNRSDPSPWRRPGPPSESTLGCLNPVHSVPFHLGLCCFFSATTGVHPGNVGVGSRRAGRLSRNKELLKPHLCRHLPRRRVPEGPGVLSPGWRLAQVSRASLTSALLSFFILVNHENTLARRR